MYEPLVGSEHHRRIAPGEHGVEKVVHWVARLEENAADSCRIGAACRTDEGIVRRGLVAVWTPDKIELANPGDFRVDVDKALNGGMSDPRNATMLKIFSFVKIGERAGSGLPKIYDGWTSCGYEPPTFEESFDPDRTMLTLSLSKNPAEKNGGITIVQENEVLTLLGAEGSAGRSDFVEALGVGPSRVKDILSSMVEPYRARRAQPRPRVPIARRRGRITSCALATPATISNYDSPSTPKERHRHETL